MKISKKEIMLSHQKKNKTKNFPLTHNLNFVKNSRMDFQVNNGSNSRLKLGFVGFNAMCVLMNDGRVLYVSSPRPFSSGKLNERREKKHCFSDAARF